MDPLSQLYMALQSSIFEYLPTLLQQKNVEELLRDLEVGPETIYIMKNASIMTNPIESIKTFVFNVVLKLI